MPFQKTTSSRNEDLCAATKVLGAFAWSLASLCICLAPSTSNAAPQIVAGQPTVAGKASEVAAIAGEPFGVARVRYSISPKSAGDKTLLMHTQTVASSNTQVLYPAFAEVRARVERREGGDRNDPRIGRGRLLGRVVDLVREATGVNESLEQVVGQEVWFLFKGSEPFTVTIKDPQNLGQQGLRLTVTPRSSGVVDRSAGGRGVADRNWSGAMAGWWKVFTTNASQRIEAGDYPPLVEHYLVGMLARRLQLPIPESLKSKPDPDKTSILTVLEQVAGAEAMRSRTFARVAQGDTERFMDAQFPVPADPLWVDTPVDDVDPQVTIEGVASRVPLNSFYIRFGSFSNYLWFRELGNRHGGDITKMVTLRGFDYQATKRIETQLNMEATELSLLLGGTVIDDMAIIGHDLFLTEGASLGVLLKAKSAFLLGTSLRSERSATVSKVPDATLRDVNIGGKTVSFLSTPDNRIRSYLAMDGEYALVSNSETLIDLFLKTGQGAACLAQSPSFRYARSLMRQENDYKIFAYFSDEFFQNLVGPKYQIELRRRLYANADVEVIQLARLAAAAEGNPLLELDELVAGGYLPDGIERRPDGGGPILAGDQILDSRRGKRGYFLPIADVELKGVTADELAWYKRQADFYAANWQEMDPLVAGIRSVDSPNPGMDRVEIHAEVVPLVPKKYGWIAEQLGPPTTEMIRFGQDDIAAMQAYVVSSELGGTIPPHHLFVAIKDAMLPNPAEVDGILDGYRALKSLSGYLGAWPQPGLLDRLPLGLGVGRPVGPGMNRLLVGLYRYQGNGFSLISFLPEIITASVPNLSVAEASEPAQVRFHVDSLEGTRVETWANQQLYARSFEASLAGAQLLQSLTSQLSVPPQSAKETVQQLFDARLQCPLGGEYVFQSVSSAGRRGDGAAAGQDSPDAVWLSTAWSGRDRELGSMPDDFQAPLLKWFRGTSGRLTQYKSRLVADLLLDMKNGL